MSPPSLNPGPRPRTSQDSIVEAKRSGSASWYEAKVKSVKGGYTVVAFLGEGLGAPDAFVVRFARGFGSRSVCLHSP